MFYNSLKEENETQVRNAHIVETFHACNHEFTILFRSTGKKVCRLCKAVEECDLKGGRQPLITSSRDKAFTK